ncbi:MAG: GIY-YIG nuclease family protein [Candidatus Pacebacteria bacterium]|nr:GIY-YIG nuclease family protein [Candidatus Paceibacterota bacterium]
MTFVYILQCSDDTLYIGSTNDIKRRIYEHNNLKSGAHYTKIRRPVKLVYQEVLETLSLARKREVVLKKLNRSSKLALVASYKQKDISL